MEHYSAIKTECSVDRQHERVMKSEDVREASHGDHKWLDFFFQSLLETVNPPQKVDWALPGAKEV